MVITKLDEVRDSGEGLAASFSWDISFSRILMQEIERVPHNLLTPEQAKMILRRAFLMQHLLQRAQYQIQRINESVEQTRRLQIQQRRAA